MIWDYYSIIVASDMIKTYMYAWCLRLPRFETCSQQRKATGRPLSIRKFLACARPSKLTTTKIYTHGVLLCCVSCPRNTDYWCCAISSSTAFFLSFFLHRTFLHCYLMCISDLSNAPWKVGQFCMFVYKCCGTFSPPNIDTIRRIDEFIHVFFLHFHKCRPIFFVSMDNIILCDFSHKTWRGTKYFVLWDTIHVQMLMNRSNHNTYATMCQNRTRIGLM